MKPVELLDDMYPQQFVMISKGYSDGISLFKDGPQITKKFSSDCMFDAEKTYRTEATFFPKLMPKHFVTTLTVADEITYYESIAFERRIVMKNFSETTNVFLPKEVKQTYCSSLMFDPDATTRSYITSIELLPAQKCDVTAEFNVDTIECVNKRAVNGEIHCREQLINGEM